MDRAAAAILDGAATANFEQPHEPWPQSADGVSERLRLCRNFTDDLMYRAAVTAGGRRRACGFAEISRTTSCTGAAIIKGGAGDCPLPCQNSVDDPMYRGRDRQGRGEGAPLLCRNSADDLMYRGRDH
jgi:hypothetical protein